MSRNEDTDTARSSEVIGYIVMESGTHTVEGINFNAAVGAGAIDGVDGNGSTYSSLNGSLAVVSKASNNGNDGGWAVLNNNTAPDGSGDLHLMIDEDTIGDVERNHTTEQVASEFKVIMVML